MSSGVCVTNENGRGGRVMGVSIEAEGMGAKTDGEEKMTAGLRLHV